MSHKTVTAKYRNILLIDFWNVIYFFRNLLPPNWKFINQYLDAVDRRPLQTFTVDNISQ